MSSQAKERNGWVGHEGPAAFDLRSDTATAPTPSMLEAIANCSLFDDIWEEDHMTKELEAYVAEMTGKEAGLLVISGTMANQLAMRTLLMRPPHGIICDAESHLNIYEAGGAASLTGAQLQPVTPANVTYLTLEDIRKHAILDDDPHHCPTRLVSLENTLNGTVMPLAEIRRVAEFARANDLAMFLDGSRLWEAVAAGAGSLRDYCAPFDAVALCFCKGLGAPLGSILVGSRAFVAHARRVRKSIGGGLHQSGVVAAPAMVAVRETFEGGLLAESHEMAKKVEALWEGLGGKFVRPRDTNMCWLDLESAGVKEERLAEVSREEGLKMTWIRVVTSYQVARRADEVLPKLERVFRRVLEEAREGRSVS